MVDSELNFKRELETVAASDPNWIPVFFFFLVFLSLVCRCWLKHPDSEEMSCPLGSAVGDTTLYQLSEIIASINFSHYDVLVDSTLDMQGFFRPKECFS